MTNFREQHLSSKNRLSDTALILIPSNQQTGKRKATLTALNALYNKYKHN